MKQGLAELAHHVLAHPVWGVSIAFRSLAVAVEREAERLYFGTDGGAAVAGVWGFTLLLTAAAVVVERGAERLHAATARAAWPTAER